MSGICHVRALLVVVLPHDAGARRTANVTANGSPVRQAWPDLPRWVCATAALVLIALSALAQFAMGRKLWGVSGRRGIWSGDIWSTHNSQFLTDPYTFSHVTHGVLWYGLLWLIAGKIPVRIRFILGVAIECAWEVFENTDFIIRRYRAVTISLDYYGDSVMNSLCDVLAGVVGFLIAAVLPARVTVVVVLMLEIALALWIRDNLALNVLMLLWPIRIVRSWQLAR